MSLFEQIFGQFDAQSDVNASLKIAMTEIIRDGRLGELRSLLDHDGNFDVIEGQPGWSIERRGVHDTDWPQGMEFRSVVDPEFLALTYPVKYLKQADLIEMFNMATDKSGH